MGSFGDRLRREREQRGITLDDVALTTKIRAGLLKALEEEKFEQLPGGIFNKGFVRAYAQHLGIDEEQAVADYLVASGEAPIPPKPGEIGAARSEVAEPRIQLVREEKQERSVPSRPWSLWAGLLVLLVVGAAAWLYYHGESRAETPSAAAQPSGVTAGTTRPPEAGAAATPASPPSPKAGDGLAGFASSTATSASESGTFTVKLKTDDECWMQITNDGKSEEVTMPANTERVITAKDKLVIRAGNVGALDILFNGRALASQGEYGEVKTLTFGPQGLEVPIATP